MHFFALSRLHCLWNFIYPRLCMMSSFAPFSTPKQLIAAKDFDLRPNELNLPFSALRIVAQPTIDSQEFLNEKMSIGHLSSTDYTNISASNNKSFDSFMQPVSLRVFREYDKNVAQHYAGRMVISGRMKDVCAEIDRLAKPKV